MPHRTETDSRRMLRQLRDEMASAQPGQERLDRITTIISGSMGTDVCSIYLLRDSDTLELCATEGLRASAVHETRLRIGEGLVGKVARLARPIQSANAPAEPGFRYMPETGEEVFTSFLGVPIQRLGERLGVLVVQSKESRNYTDDEVYGLEVVAMVIAEMTELGAFVGEGTSFASPHQLATTLRGVAGQEGEAEGHVWLHQPRVVITNLVNDDSQAEIARLNDAIEKLRGSVDDMLAVAASRDKEHQEVLQTYKMFAHSRGWLKRMEEDIRLGLSAEAAVEKEQSTARARLETVPDQYMRDRLHDLDDLSNRLLRILTGQGVETGAEMPDRAILVARNIGPGDLLEYGRKLRGVVLEEGAVGSHATIVARALAIPLVLNVPRITTDALSGDHILVDGTEGLVHLRPDDSVTSAFRDKMAMRAKAQERYASLRDKPAIGRCGTQIKLKMNAGLMADLPSLPSSGAEAVGLFRTELQFLTRERMPRRSELVATYARVLDAAAGKPVHFRTLDIGSDKVAPYMKRPNEPNPAMGWRALRVGLDKPGVLRMQVQALIRAAAGRPLSVIFPLVSTGEEFMRARDILNRELDREGRLGHPLPEETRVGAMLETPSLAYAPDSFFEAVDFISIGGNDLKQFFFAADRENELVRRRYDTLNVSFLSFLQLVVDRCHETETALTFCGEDAGRPVDALAFAGIGIPALSMRPASIGPVKSLIRRSNLNEVSELIARVKARGLDSARTALLDYVASLVE